MKTEEGEIKEGGGKKKGGGGGGPVSLVGRGKG